MARLASLIVRHAGAYGDLIADDMQCAYTALARRLWVGVVLVVSVMFALALACVGVIAMTWDTPNRLPMIAGLCSVFVCASLAALIGLRNQRRQQRDFIPQTGLEWQKDRRLLDDLLVKARDNDSRDDTKKFPRSKTFRWILTHPVGRWLGSAVLTGALYQVPFGRTIGAFLQSSKRSASAKK